MTDYPEARAIFAEFGIEVVPANAFAGPGQTRAVATLDRIIRRYGYDRARLVVMTLAETGNKQGQGEISETTLWAVADMAQIADKNYPDLLRNNVSEWFRFFDGVPIATLAYWCKGLDGIASKRFALVGMLWERMERVFGGWLSDPMEGLTVEELRHE